jgi:hypothetical protein
MSKWSGQKFRRAGLLPALPLRLLLGSSFIFMKITIY